MPEAILVFVAAESQAKLVERLAARKTETAVGIVGDFQTVCITLRNLTFQLTG